MAAKKRNKTDPCLSKIAETLNGKPYDYLEAPGTFQIQPVGGSILDKIPDSDIEKIGSFWLKCEDVRVNGLPLDPRDAKAANPRAPDDEHAVVSDMQDTMTKNPEKFTTLNGGISIVCDNVKPDKTKKGVVNITLEDGDGIVNGGHTYYSMNSMPKSGIDDSAYVKVEVIQIAASVTGKDRREVIKNIAVSKNRNRAISDESEANFLGHFDPWKKELGQFAQRISWKDGATVTDGSGDRIDDPLRAKELIKLMFFMEYNNSNFHVVYNPNKSGLVQPGAGHWAKWVKEVTNTHDPIGWMMPLALPILSLRDKVYDDLPNVARTVPMTTLVKKRGKATGGPGTQMKNGRWHGTDFGNWLLMGTRKTEQRVPSFFDSSIGILRPGAMAEMLFGNFRSLLWRKLNSKNNEVLVGWQVDPWIIWGICRDAIIGSLYHEWTEGNHKPISFRRQLDEAFTIDFCEWVFVKSKGKSKINLRSRIDEYTPPVLIYHSNKEWRKAKKRETPTMWLNISVRDSDYAEFTKASAGKHTQGYVELV